MQKKIFQIYCCYENSLAKNLIRSYLKKYNLFLEIKDDQNRTRGDFF